MSPTSYHLLHPAMGRKYRCAHVLGDPLLHFERNVGQRHHRTLSIGQLSPYLLNDDPITWLHPVQNLLNGRIEAISSAVVGYGLSLIHISEPTRPY